MTEIADMLRYFARVIEAGDTLNKWLGYLPFEIQESTVSIGEWLAALLGY
jgi:hypothetical protein